MANKTLLIVESPTKAKTISKFLGRNYTVKATMGHVRDLPKSQLGVDVENNFAPRYITIRGKGDIVKELRSLVKKSDRVLLATDPDREGEAISWHLQNVLNLDQQDKCRVEFHEITKDAVKTAVKNPRSVNNSMVDAQQARRVLDRLVGYKLSPLLWKKVSKGLSAGRVQSVALKIICDREEEILQFKPEEYWSVNGIFCSAACDVSEKANHIEAKLMKYKDKAIDIKNKQQAEKTVADIRNQQSKVADINHKEKKRYPAPPFTTSTLQQEAYKHLNYTPRKTMMIIQQLYEGIDLGKQGTLGLITYIRTDSTRISDSARQEAAEFIINEYGKKYVNAGSTKRNNKKASVQDAHEAIRPTSVNLQPDNIKEFLTRDQYRMYQLIWKRFVSSQMSPMISDETILDISAGDYKFRANDAVMKFPGFMLVYKDYGSKEDKNIIDSHFLPYVSVNDPLTIVELQPKQHFTQPPPRYSDATLIKYLEEKGIGRPSTYAPIVEIILQRRYVVRDKKLFCPTELGITINEMLKEYFPKILDIGFTADMEHQLDDIAEGKTNWTDTISAFYKPFAADLDKAEKEISKIKIEDQVSDEKCEVCGRNLVVKMGRFGKFLACPAFPECRFTKPLLEQTGISCPECSGEIVLRRSKKGRAFYGCSNYPECTYTLWHKPTAHKCPQCDSILMEVKGKNKKLIYKCSNESCNYQRSADSEEE